MRSDKLQDVAAFVLEEAIRLGATDAEVKVGTSTEVGFQVRMGKIESTGGGEQTKSVGFTVWVGDKKAEISPISEFRRAPLRALLRRRIDAARNSLPDPFTGLPETQYLAQAPFPELDLYCQQIASLSQASKIELAFAAEAAAFDSDPRITNSEGAQFSNAEGRAIYANSKGFFGELSANQCELGLAVIAQGKDGKMEVGYAGKSSRKLSLLQDPVAMGKEAASNALRMLGARKVHSQKVPVVFDPHMSASLLGHLVNALDGDRIYRRQSFLAGKLGELVAVSSLSIVDDPFIKAGHGSRPFGASGIALRRREIVLDGRLNGYFLDAVEARRLKMEPTGEVNNLSIQGGDTAPGAIIKSIKSGLYVTQVSGQGTNLVNGDYSRGASGLWIENGEFAYPVQEITIASNLLAMFSSIEAVGNDLAYDSQVCAPTLLVGEMQVAGK